MYIFVLHSFWNVSVGEARKKLDSLSRKTVDSAQLNVMHTCFNVFMHIIIKSCKRSSLKITMFVWWWVICNPRSIRKHIVYFIFFNPRYFLTWTQVFTEMQKKPKQGREEGWDVRQLSHLLWEPHLSHQGWWMMDFRMIL